MGGRRIEMTKKEFSIIAAAMRTYYPKENLLPSNESMELWYRELSDIPYNVAEAGLRKWVATNKWSPTIADMREFATTVQIGDIPEWGEGWEQVLMAIRRYGSYRIPEATESFDPITRRCVERLGFRNICMSENIAVDRANFRDMYKQMAERQRKDAQLPSNLMTLIEGITKSNVLLEEK